MLQLEGLVTAFDTPRVRLCAVDGVSLQVAAGRALCIAGESGCGKCATALSVMGPLPNQARVGAGCILARDRDLLPLPPA